MAIAIDEEINDQINSSNKSVRTAVNAVLSLITSLRIQVQTVILAAKKIFNISFQQALTEAIEKS